MEIKIEFLLNLKDGQASVAPDCKPSYLGVRDQKDQGLRPARKNSSGGPDLKITNTRKMVEGCMQALSACLTRMRPRVQNPVPPIK
jgi:hypothetical protein